MHKHNKDSMMHIYLVGGAVRDKLLRRPVKDRDWVVVGADVHDMLTAGYVPVGRDFPVFLHPKTKEEYALARTERKVASGYAGFTFHADRHVSLIQDLQRRDLTINAMAEQSDSTLIDPYGGLADLRAGILRHVSAAFTEDPVRILRTARFAARYQFNVAPETLSLMQYMVEQGEIHALVPERVWQELAKGLMESSPQRMIQVLRDCHALSILLPELEALFSMNHHTHFYAHMNIGTHAMRAIQYAAKHDYSLAERYATLLCHVSDMSCMNINQRWRVPKDCAKLALLACTFHQSIHQVAQLSAHDILNILKRTDAFRRPTRFQSLLRVCMADISSTQANKENPYQQQYHWSSLLEAATNIDTATIASKYTNNAEIAMAITQHRLQSIQPMHEHYQHIHDKASI